MIRSSACGHQNWRTRLDSWRATATLDALTAVLHCARTTRKCSRTPVDVSICCSGSGFHRRKVSPSDREEYFRAFFRGCIDGDGSIVVYTDRYHASKNARYIYQRLYVVLVSGSTISELLLGVSGSIAPQRRKGRRPLGRLRYAKRESPRVLGSIYYSSSGVCLARKRITAEAFISSLERDTLVDGGVAELAYATDSKSVARKGVGVQLPSPPPLLSLTGVTLRLYRDPSRGAVAQLGEHKAGSLGVRGSNPLSSTIFRTA
jgi:hypothetical protein